MKVERARFCAVSPKEGAGARLARRLIAPWLIGTAAISWTGGLAAALATGNGTPELPLLAAAFAVPLVLAVPLWVIASRGAARLGASSDRLLALDGVDAASFEVRNPVLRTFADLERACDSAASNLLEQMQSDAAAIVELSRSKDHAVSASVAKSQFLTDMSHELRTPLNAIIGYSTLLQEDAIGSGRAQEEADLGRVLGAGRRLLGLINDILELSRIESGRTAFERSIVDVPSLVRSAMSGFDMDREGNGNRLDLDIGPGVGIMVTDAAKVRQCLLNLIGNALKFTRDGQVRLSVRPSRRDGVEVIEFEVSDTGVGMSEEQTRQLFHDRSDPSSKPQPTVPKLGLVITHRLATMMGGSISVRSTLDSGSAFTLAIPREVPRLLAQDAPIPQPSPAVRLAGQRTALVIDDEPTAIDIMRRWLSRLGYAVVAASDGEAGLALARSERPDVIILDIFMPGASGYDVLDVLKADEDLASIPVIVVSVSDDRGRSLRSGASDILMKPVPPERLQQVLDVYSRPIEGEILIIEDDEDAGELVRRAAAQIGLDAVRAGSGEAGLEFARTRAPAAIVLDLTLPGMDGFAVLDALRGDEQLSNIPVLIVSGREISVAEHQAITRAGGIYHPKGYASPRQIAESLKMVVTR